MHEKLSVDDEAAFLITRSFSLDAFKSYLCSRDFVFWLRCSQQVLFLVLPIWCFFWLSQLNIYFFSRFGRFSYMILLKRLCPSLTWAASHLSVAMTLCLFVCLFFRILLGHFVPLSDSSLVSCLSGSGICSSTWPILLGSRLSIILFIWLPETFKFHFTLSFLPKFYLFVKCFNILKCFFIQLFVFSWSSFLHFSYLLSVPWSCL